MDLDREKHLRGKYAAVFRRERDQCPICHGLDSCGWMPRWIIEFQPAFPCVCKLRAARSLPDVRAFSDLSAFRDLTFDAFDSSVRGTRDVRGRTRLCQQSI
jgi:hypothetical protein